MSFLRSFSAAGLLIRLLSTAVGSSSAQAVTVFGVVYPTVTHTLGAYVLPQTDIVPQFSIVGIDTSLRQTTFAYYNVYTQIFAINDVPSARPVTESVMRIQRGGRRCVSGCERRRDGATVTTAAITGVRAPLFTFIATLPITAVTAPTSTSGSGSASQTQHPPQTSPATSHKATVPVGAIVAAVIGGVVLVGGALGALLFCRRRRHNSYQGEKVELDPEPVRVHAPLITQMDSTPSSPSCSGNRPLPTSSAPSSAGAYADTDTTASSSETPRQRLKQMQRNLSITSRRGADGIEAQVVAQQRQIDMLLEEVGRLRAMVARDEGLPAYER
ncbi:hypothetical protein DFH08DRAFT_943038 [Mycena albidolilacea]|uniref:Uncharacterized protein n=1 Tax=Mycena albidolilacea TaxID=1033008 RepID=A0AAD6ZB31_9AGAR|nr:hypothetical protein DFH08DRAFT_943038 [Mycena albidolilacea]